MRGIVALHSTVSPTVRHRHLVQAGGGGASVLGGGQHCERVPRLRAFVRASGELSEQSGGGCSHNGQSLFCTVSPLLSKRFFLFLHPGPSAEAQIGQMLAWEIAQAQRATDWGGRDMVKHGFASCKVPKEGYGLTDNRYPGKRVI